MKKKLMIAIPLLLVLAGAGYKMTAPKPKVAPPKVAGEIYLLPGGFLLNMSDGRYAKFSIALELAPGQSDGASATAAAGDSSAATTIGTLPEEALIRDLIVNTVTGQPSAALVNAASRARIAKTILNAITTQTDVKVTQVLFPDLAVQ
jgi:flagellar FliL protein